MKQNKLYEGKAKILYSTENENEIIQYFKDSATAFNNKKKDIINKKGILNNLISEFIMLEISKQDIPTHFIKRLNDREQLVKKAQIIPLEIIIRNIAAGSISKNLNIEEGKIFNKPIFEICYKDDSLQDPLINEDHAIIALDLITNEQLELIKKYSLKINIILQNIFSNININLVDFKIEFGFNKNGKIILADEISPDSCRLWDKDSNEKMDKDRFRKNLGGLIEAYQEIATRLGIINQ